MMNFDSLFSLAGKTALITGGSRGIGAMFVDGFLSAGCERIFITARKGHQVAAAVERFGDRVVGFAGDVSTVAGCRAVAAEIAARTDRLDILINNAGAAWSAPLADFPESGWDKVMDVNVKAPFFLTQALLPQLKAAAAPGRPAKVVNIGSIDGLRLNPWETYSYHASKSAILYLTKRMAAALVSDGINVTAIAPGAFESDMNTAARDHGDAVGTGIPAGRIGTPEDMAAAAIYLCSRAGDYVVGETLTVDGGLVHAALGASIDG